MASKEKKVKSFEVCNTEKTTSKEKATMRSIQSEVIASNTETFMHIILKLLMIKYLPSHSCLEGTLNGRHQVGEEVPEDIIMH